MPFIKLPTPLAMPRRLSADLDTMRHTASSRFANRPSPSLRRQRLPMPLLRDASSSSCTDAATSYSMTFMNRVVNSGATRATVAYQTSYTPSVVSIRHFSNRDADLDIPPLDLSRSSLSIPLPLNISKDTKLNGDHSTGDVTKSATKKRSNSSRRRDLDFEIPPLDLLSTTLPLPPSLQSMPSPPPKVEAASTKPNHPSLAAAFNKSSTSHLALSSEKKSASSLTEMTRTEQLDKKVSGKLSDSQTRNRQKKRSRRKKRNRRKKRSDARKVELEMSKEGDKSQVVMGKQGEEGFTQPWEVKLQEKANEIQKKLSSGNVSGVMRAKLRKNLTQTQRDMKRFTEAGTAPSQQRIEQKKRSRVQRRVEVDTYDVNADLTVAPPPSIVSCPRSNTIDIQPPTNKRGKYPTPSFRGDVITTQANGTILGQCGNTAVLSTVITPPPYRPMNDDNPSRRILLNAIQLSNARSGAMMVPLQVDYRERYHAAGKIPVHNRRRRDNSGPLTDREVLASRVIDRTIRPWLMMGLASSDKAISLPGNIVVNCEVQSYDSRASSINGSSQRTHGDPTALAVNSTIAALYQAAYSNSSLEKFPVPLEAAACVKLAIQRDGSVVYDPSPNESEDAKFELLYAGTKDRVLMLEFGANGAQSHRYAPGNDLIEDPGVSETTVANALMLAQEAILPIIEQQEQLRQNYRYNASDSTGEELMTDGEVAQLLGLE
eukprot:g7253.t1 g7253   contig24:210333-212477(+)